MYEPNRNHIRLTYGTLHEPNECYNRLMIYNWQQEDWPQFRYDLSGVEDTLLAFAETAGRATGILKVLTADAQAEAAIEMMVAEAIQTSAIEGELLSRRDVMSSIRKNLGLDGGAAAGDRRAEGAARMMVDVRNSFAEPLSEGSCMNGIG